MAKHPPLVAKAREKKMTKRDIVALERHNALKRKWLDDYLKDPSAFLRYAARLAAKPVQARRLNLFLGSTPRVTFEMCCVRCGKWKEATNMFFMTNNKSLHNSRSNPCRKCTAEIMFSKHRTVEHEAARRLMNPYRNLRPKDMLTYPDTPVGWFWEQWRKQGGDWTCDEKGRFRSTRPARCSISGVPMRMGGIHEAWCVSVNNSDLSLGSNLEDHQSESCELILAELNVQQHSVIPDLAKAWQEVITDSIVRLDMSAEALQAERAELESAARTNWENRKNTKLNGVTANSETERKLYKQQVRNLDLSAICGAHAANHRRHDGLKGRANDMGREDIYAKLCAQPLCSSTGVPMTIINGPRRFSVDRIDNSIGHTKANTRLVCRILNSPAGMTRRKWLELLLLQTVVPLSEDQRGKVQNELNAIPLV